MLLALVMLLGLVACGASEPSPTAAPTEAPKQEAPQEEAPAAPAEKKPEDYTGNLVIYSPHDPNPLEAGVSMFMDAYPNINVAFLSIPTGEAIQRIAAESEVPCSTAMPHCCGIN